VSSNLFNSLKKFFKRYDHFLVVEVLDSFIRLSEFKVDFPKKQIIFLKSELTPNTLSDLDQTFAKLKKIVSHFSLRTRSRVLFSLDPVLVTTIVSSVMVLRDTTGEVITDSDFDNLISQATWKVFDRQRMRAAEKMGVGDLAVALTDVKVMKIKLDGSRVLNPLGFKARAIEFQLLQTMSSKKVVEALKKIFPKAELEFLKEGGMSTMEVLRKVDSAPNFLLADIFYDHTDIFWFEGNSMHFVDHFRWGIENLWRALEGALSVQGEIAKVIWELYLDGKLSSRLARRFDQLILPELQLLAHGLNTYISRVSSKIIYLCPFSRLPQLVFRAVFSKDFSAHPRLRLASLDFFREWFTFEFRPEAVSLNNNSFPIIANLLEFYFLPQDDTINKIARRHARWLVSS